MEKRKYKNDKDVSIFDAGVIMKCVFMVMIKQTTQKTKVKRQNTKDKIQKSQKTKATYRFS